MHITPTRQAVEAVTAYRAAQAQAIDRLVDRVLIGAAVLALAVFVSGCAAPAPDATRRVQDHTPQRGEALRSAITECWTAALIEADRRAAQDAAATGRPVDRQAVQTAAVPLARACLLMQGVDLPSVER